MLKRLTFLTAMLAMLVPSFALTIDQFFDQLSTLPEAQFVVLDKDQLRAMADTVQTEKDKQFINNAERIMMLMTSPDDSEIRTIESAIKALDGYSTVVMYTEKDIVEEESDDDEIYNLLFADEEPEMETIIYATQKNGDLLSQPLVMMRMFGIWALMYFDCDIEIEDLKNSLNFSVKRSYTIDDGSDDCQGGQGSLRSKATSSISSLQNNTQAGSLPTVEEIETINSEPTFKMTVSDDFDTERIGRLIGAEEYLIAFNGQLRPDLKNIPEASEYIKSNGLESSGFEIVYGRDNVSARFPDTDIELVINYNVNSDSK